MDPAPDCGRPAAARFRRLRQEPGGGCSVGSQDFEGRAGRNPQASGRLRKRELNMGWKILLVGPLLSGPIVDALSRTLFHFLWEGALIALALAVSIHVFRPS